LPTKTPKKSVEAPTARLSDDLARAVLKVLVAGNGRSNRCEVKQELPQRLAADGVKYDPNDLPRALIKLEDSGCITRVQRQPYSAYPQYIVSNGLSRYDQSDELAANIAACIKRRGDRFENEDQLGSWLDQDGISYAAQSLAVALHQTDQASLARSRSVGLGSFTAGLLDLAKDL
jgi:hypothetical protein